MQVKICGIVDPEDGLFAINSGANAIGLVFCSNSKRKVNIEIAQSIIASLPCFKNIVGLFQDQDQDEVLEILNKVPLNILQFHGSESFQYCESFNRPYIKAFFPKDDLIENNPSFLNSNLMFAVLADSGSGSGEIFDWKKFIIKNQGISKKPLILAGGLNPENVAEAIKIVKPQAVDVSSGVESELHPPRKDHNKIKQFISNVFKS